MIGRLMILAMIPAWIWVVLAVTTGFFGVIVVLVLVVGGATSTISADLHYQCDSAVGPDPSLTETATPRTTVAPPTGAAARAGGAGDAGVISAAPTLNPYAELTLAPNDSNVSDWQRACVSVIRSAPYQMPALLTPGNGLLGDCARELAVNNALTAATGSADGGASGAAGAAGLTRVVIYQASAAAVTGRCDRAIAPPVEDPEPATVAPIPSGTTRQPGSGVTACGQVSNTGKAAIVLPKNIAAQAACGQRVDPAAVSAGDLVFWDYRSNAPTRTGIALDAAQVLTYDPSSGRFVQQSMPTGSDVRVKRVLGGGS